MDPQLLKQRELGRELSHTNLESLQKFFETWLELSPDHEI